MKERYNLPVKNKFLCHCHSINREKSCICRSTCRSTQVISAFILRVSRTRLYMRKRECAKRTWFWRSWLPCWLVINGIYDQLASNQKHPFIASMYEPLITGGGSRGTGGCVPPKIFSEGDIPPKIPRRKKNRREK